jgi:hypothetical protein
MVTFSKTEQQLILVEKIWDSFEELFPGRVVSMGTCPARSPDLTPLDFSIFGFLKTKIFKEYPFAINHIRILMYLYFEVRLLPFIFVERHFVFYKGNAKVTR